jgi:hypothetical protein
MEIKDWIYSFGLILTFGVSVFSLILNIKNRKNAIREHLYKEQMSFFFKLSNEFAHVYKLFEDIWIEQTFNDSQDILLETHLNNIHTLIDTHDFIIPNQIYSTINQTIESLNDLYKLVIDKDRKITDKELNKYSDMHSNLVEDIREFAGVDELSEENKRLYNKK